MKKNKLIKITLIIAIFLSSLINVNLFAATSEAPTIDFTTKRGELVKNSKINVVIKDPDGISFIRYGWDYYRGNTNFVDLTLTKEERKKDEYVLQLDAPTTNGVHVLHVCAQDTKGNPTQFYDCPYYVVDSLSGQEDKVRPSINTSILPSQDSQLDLGQELTLAATDDKTGIYLIAYRWTKELNSNVTSSDFKYTYEVDSLKINAKNEPGIWYLQAFAQDCVGNICGYTNRRYNVVDKV